MKINNVKVVKRWNGVMMDVGVEYMSINTVFSELEDCKEYYGVENGISIDWMIKEAKYWLSCYYEEGNVRCDERYENEHCYKIWLSESGKLKRLIATLEKMENSLVVEW